uniref:Uncharacterized protein n=1 Tax=Kwoniella pini CBS 10737 TaxID=1296096 RepID=A0A1B9IEC9_9TREE|nr:uncharacterized protein I206_01219 [Kwoniella pini CBS 10737]OCF53912.1 hypothetical protein I206_01219 [Kwoniella pini CBS 10737]
MDSILTKGCYLVDVVTDDDDDDEIEELPNPSNVADNQSPTFDSLDLIELYEKREEKANDVFVHWLKRFEPDLRDEGWDCSDQSTFNVL